jgi:hypothetical protein
LELVSKEIGLEVNVDKTKYMVMSQDQTAGRSHSMKIDNSASERVEEFKYLEIIGLILPVVLCVCETWSLTLREERRLRVFENRGLRRRFGSKTDKVKRELRKLHIVELHDMYSSSNIVWVIKSRRMRKSGHVVRIGKGTGLYGFLVGNPEGKRPMGKPRRRWENNFKMDI